MACLNHEMWIERRAADDATTAFQLFLYADQNREFNIAEEAREVLYEELLGSILHRLLLGVEDIVDGNLSQHLHVCDRRGGNS